jgi:hypothetical protein
MTVVEEGESLPGDGLSRALYAAQTTLTNCEPQHIPRLCPAKGPPLMPFPTALGCGSVRAASK